MNTRTFSGALALIIAFSAGAEVVHASEVTPVGEQTPPGDCTPVSLSGLVGWWRGEGDATDAMGLNHGIAMNGLSFAPGKVGQGFFFDGVDDFVRVPDSPSLDLTNEITMEMWFNTVTWSGGHWALMDKRTLNNVNYGAAGAEGLGFYLYYDDPNVGGGYEQSFAPLPTTGAFHHFAGTYKQISSTQVELKIYMDGALVKTDLLPGNLANAVNNIALALGDARDGAGQSFHGIIDEISLYNRVLSAAEIEAIYRADAAGKCLPPTPPPPPPPPPGECAPVSLAGLVGWWRGEGDATDAMGLNHGIAMNGLSFVPGKVGQGFFFDGVDDFVRVPDSPSLDLTNEITMEMWFNTVTWSGGHWALMDKRTLNNVNYGAAGAEGIGFYLYYDDPNVGGGYEQSFAPLPTTGAFHHFAGTYKQISSTQVELKIYLDGALVKTDVLPGNLANAVNDIALALGDARDGAGQSFHGIIDEISLYNRVLSAAEIEAIYRADAAGKCLPTTENSPPVARITLAQQFTIEGAPHALVIACDGQEAEIVLDARDSTDPDGDPLTYAWFAADASQPFSTESVVTTEAGIGMHSITLTVSDGRSSASANLVFEVITPAEAAAQLSMLLEAADLPRKAKTPLRASLQAAVNSLERGILKAGIGQLTAFDNKVRAQLGATQPELAARLSAATRTILDALGKCQMQNQR